eukprot:Skav200544  [mRNA]  locus=scaffold676:310903:315876:+ [translate_table: standard]
MTFATANAQTLYQSPEGCAGKIDFLQAQFASYGLLFIGLQETRGQAGQWNNQRFLRLAADSSQGQAGVELWINLQRPYATAQGKRMYLKPHHFVALDRSTRHLLCKVEAPGFTGCILVAYAPHSGHSPQAVEDFWHRMIALRPLCNAPLVVLTDANAQLGDPDGHHVVDIGDSESPFTPVFREFIEAASLWAPSSHSIFGPWQPTWTSPDGRTAKKIDHVLLPLCWTGHCHDYATLPELELTVGEHDHTVAVAHVTHRKVLQHLEMPVRQPPIDRQLIASAHRLEEDLRQGPIQAWGQDIETQTDALNEHLMSSLRKHCPKAHSQPKKPYICPVTWDIRTQLRRARQHLRTRGGLTGRSDLKACFRAWIAAARHQDLLHGPDLLRAVLRVRQLQKQLKRQLQSNKKKHLQLALESLPPGASASEILHTLKPFRGSPNAKFFGPPPLPEVKDELGQPCATVQDLQDRWVRFLANMEGGRRLSCHDLRNKWIQDMEQQGPSDLSIPITELPSLSALEHSLRRVQKGKATGPDHIPGELCHFHAATIARQIYPMLWKLMLHGQEPLLHKGGRATTAWKRKLPQDRCEAYRALLISSHIGKSLHRTLRDHQCSIYEAFLHSDQLGGRRRVPVGLGVHMMRAFLRHCRCRKQAASILFLDLTEAFYRTIREMVMGTCNNDQELAQWAHRMGLPEDALFRLHQALRGDTALEHATYSQLQITVIRTLHSSTWFQLDKQADVVHTQVGSRPGDSYADIVFGLLFGHMLHQLHGILRTEGLVTQIPAIKEPGLWSAPSDQAEELLGPTWMDDLAIAVTASHTEQLVCKATRVAGYLVDLCRARGMSPNFSAGKTELLMVLKGKGTKEWAPRLFSDAGPRTLPVLTDQGVIQIKVTNRYKHLGAILHHGAHNNVETRQRLAQAHQAFGENSRLLLRNFTLPTGTRVQLFDSLVLSKLSYGMESWVLDTQHQRDKFESAYIRLLRRLLPVKQRGHYSNDEVYALLQAPRSQLLRRRARLRYLGTLYSCADVHTWSAIAVDSDWKHMVIDDLQWMWQQLHASSDLPDPAAEPGRWDSILRHHPKYWKKLVRRAVLHSIRQDANAWHVSNTHRRIVSRLQTAGVKIPRQEPVAAPREHHGWLSCRRTFKSHAGEAVHMNKVHGRPAKARTLVTSTQCAACLREFHTWGKIQRHLQHSKPCRAQLLSQGLAGTQPLPPGIGSTEEQHLVDQHDGLLPSLQAAGPHLPGDPARDDFADFNTEFEDALMDFLTDAHENALTIQDVETFVKEYPSSHTLSWRDLETTLQHFGGHYGSEEELMVGLASLDMQACLNSLLDPSTWTWEAGTPSEVVQCVGTVDYWHATLALPEAAEAMAQLCPCPRPLGAHRVCLHLFAGRRRPGDLQFYMDRWPSVDGVVMHVVSLDVIYDKAWGDLSRAETRLFWLRSIEEMWVLAVVSGPPCETWSRARAVELEDRRRGPRPVRSAKQPWGLQCLTLRELRQVSLGNLLLSFSLEAATAILAANGIAVVEHPAEPDDPALPSIWRLPVVQLLRAHSSVQLVRFYQGHFGAVSPKPTMLLTINIPDMAEQLWDHRLRASLPAFSSIGKAANGSFLTSPLKEYPPGLCKALAGAISMRASRTTQGCAVQPADFWDRISTMQVEYGRQLGPDCAD